MGGKCIYNLNDAILTGRKFVIVTLLWLVTYPTIITWPIGFFMTSSTNNDNNAENNTKKTGAEQFSAPENVLVELRQKIDQVDGEILQLISNRAKLAQDVAIFKKNTQMRWIQTLSSIVQSVKHKY